jgi:hypothetical protein
MQKTNQKTSEKKKKKNLILAHDNYCNDYHVYDIL